MNLNRAAVLHCYHVWALFFLAVLLDGFGLWLAYRKLHPGWLRLLIFVLGICFIVSLPFVNLALGCGLI